MNLSPPTSLSDSEDPDPIPTVSDTAFIQTPLGIVTIDVLLRCLFSRTERYHKAWSDPNSGGESPEEGQGNLPTRLGIEILSSTRAEMEGKGHNLRTLRNRGFAALGTAALRRSLRKKRQNEENGAHKNGEPFNAAPLLENARPGQEVFRSAPPYPQPRFRYFPSAAHVTTQDARKTRSNPRSLHPARHAPVC